MLVARVGLCLAVALAALLQSPLQRVCLKMFGMSKHARIVPRVPFGGHAAKAQKEGVDWVCLCLKKTILVCLKSCGQKEVLFPQSTSSPLPYICHHDGFSRDVPAPHPFAP